MQEDYDLMFTWLEESDELVIACLDPDSEELESEYIFDCESAYHLYLFLQKKFRKIVKVSKNPADNK